MKAPKGTLKFSVRTKKKIINVTSYYRNPIRNVSVSSLTDGPLTYNPSIYSKDEIDWLSHNTDLPGETEFRDAYGNNWLAEQLETDPVCAWCSNTLTLEFNTTRSGYQITCSYCGMTGPCESEPNGAADAFLQVVEG